MTFPALQHFLLLLPRKVSAPCADTGCTLRICPVSTALWSHHSCRAGSKETGRLRAIYIITDFLQNAPQPTNFLGARLEGYHRHHKKYPKNVRLPKSAPKPFTAHSRARPGRAHTPCERGARTVCHYHYHRHHKKYPKNVRLPKSKSAPKPFTAHFANASGTSPCRFSAEAGYPAPRGPAPASASPPRPSPTCGPHKGHHVQCPTCTAQERQTL
jgi:hypothetical protein